VEPSRLGISLCRVKRVRVRWNRRQVGNTANPRTALRVRLDLVSPQFLHLATIQYLCSTSFGRGIVSKEVDSEVDSSVCTYCMYGAIHRSPAVRNSGAHKQAFRLSSRVQLRDQPRTLPDNTHEQHDSASTRRPAHELSEKNNDLLNAYVMREAH
jgi:hypothetical protein